MTKVEAVNDGQYLPLSNLELKRDQCILYKLKAHDQDGQTKDIRLQKGCENISNGLLALWSFKIVADNLIPHPVAKRHRSYLLVNLQLIAPGSTLSDEKTFFEDSKVG